MNLEVILADLNSKFPWLQCVLRSEYLPYLNTAGTVLLGWLIVCWISHVIWMLFAPLTITVLAIILICPSTGSWYLKQVSPNLENILNDFLEQFQAAFLQMYGT